MSTFYMLVGLPASGKSTLGKRLAKEKNAILVSSDQIREELFGDENIQESNEQVFEEMNKRINVLLSEGKSVIHDATNLNRKRRKHLIRHIIKADRKIVYYLNEYIPIVKERNKYRDRKVQDYVIDRMYRNLQIPVLNEGWDEVIYNSTKVTLTNDNLSKKIRLDLESTISSDIDHESLFDALGFMDDFMDILDLSQDSSYHSFSVSRHTYHTYKFIKDNYDGKDKIEMLWASLFHDIGKAFCKSFINYKGEETKYAQFLGHEHVSSQLAAYWLTHLDYDDESVKNVVTLVQFHMMPMNASEKKMKEIKHLMGDNLYSKLLVLHEADTQAK